MVFSAAEIPANRSLLLYTPRPVSFCSFFFKSLFDDIQRQYLVTCGAIAQGETEKRVVVLFGFRSTPRRPTFYILVKK